MASDAIVDLVVNADGAERTINRDLNRIVNEAERRAPDIDIDVNVDRSGIARLMDGLENIGRHAREADDNSNRLSGSLRSVAGTASGIATTAFRLTSVAGVAAAGVPAVAGLVSALAQIAPAAAVGVAAFTTMKAASATLKVGLIGVSDALGAVFSPDADPAAVEEALKNLSDNAKDFVRVLQDMRPALDSLRLEVQDKLFQDLADTMRDTGKVVLPELESAALSFAGTFNKMARGVANQAQTLSKTGVLGRALQGGSDAFAELERIPGQVLSAIVRLSAGGSSGLDRLARGFASVADSASQALTNAAETGALDSAINGAIDTIKQLGSIANNVFGAIGNLMDIAGDAGLGLFDSLERVTQLLEDATATTAFRDAFSSLVQVGLALANAVLPVLAAAFQAMLPVIQTLSPFVADFVKLLGEQLLRIIPALSPVLVELANVFGQILIAVEPLIVAFTDILIAILPDLIPLFQELARLITELAPLIKIFAEGLIQLIPLFRALIVGISTVIGWLATLIGWVNDVTQVTQRLGHDAIFGVLIPAFRALSALLRGDFSSAWRLGQQVVQTFVSQTVRNIRTFSSSVVSFISSGVNQAAARVQSGFSAIASAIASRLASAISRVRSFPGQVRSAFSGLGSILFSSGSAMIQGLINGMLSRLRGAVSAASKIVSSIRDYFPFSPAKKGPFSGRKYSLYSGQALIRDFAKGIRDKTPDVDRSVISAIQAASRFPRAVDAGNPLAPLSAVRPDSGFTGFSGATFNRTGSSVGNITVMLGNEQFRDTVQVLIDGNFHTFNRTASQGVRA